MTNDPQSLTKSNILSAAFQLFLAHGYDGTSLNRIVDQANVSKGAFYHYFPSKFDIYTDIMDVFFLAPFQDIKLDELKQLSPKKSRAQIRKHYATLPEQIRATTDQDMVRVFALMFDGFARRPKFQTRVAKQYRALIKALAQSFAQSKSPGKKYKKAARKFIAVQEGNIFLDAVLSSK